jgi:hypothetical protein
MSPPRGLTVGCHFGAVNSKAPQRHCCLLLSVCRGIAMG